MISVLQTVGVLYRDRTVVGVDKGDAAGTAGIDLPVEVVNESTVAEIILIGIGSFAVRRGERTVGLRYDIDTDMRKMLLKQLCSGSQRAIDGI